ncbi:MAG: hypothetical protein WAW80_04060 [Candidatus Saccharimonadales bacterium]
MAIIPYMPERVGSLSNEESAAFSKSFQHDWDYIRSEERLSGSESILLDKLEGDFNLPNSYEQFFPAIQLAADHELAVRGFMRVQTIGLTIRQWNVRQNMSQHDASYIGKAHQDLPADKPSRFYTVSDITPTEYFPQLKSPTNRDSIDIPEGEPSVIFEPYDVVASSSATFHRSPPLSKNATRTFMRLVYIYD